MKIENVEVFPNINVPEQSYLIGSQIYYLFCLPIESSTVAIPIMNLLLLKKFYYSEKLLENSRSGSGGVKAW